MSPFKVDRAWVIFCLLGNSGLIEMLLIREAVCCFCKQSQASCFHLSFVFALPPACSSSLMNRQSLRVVSICLSAVTEVFFFFFFFLQDIKLLIVKCFSQAPAGEAFYSDSLVLKMMKEKACCNCARTATGGWNCFPNTYCICMRQCCRSVEYSFGDHGTIVLILKVTLDIRLV